MHQQMYQEAYDLFLEIMKKGQADTKVFINKGITEQKLEKWEASIQSFQCAFNLKLQDDSVYTHYGLSLFKLKQYKEAQQILVQALKINSLNFKALLIRAQIGQETKDYTRALTCCNIILNSTTIYQEPTLFCKGYCLLEQQQYKQASDCFEKILKINPKNFPAKLNLIEALEGIQNYEKALNRCNECLEIQSNNPYILSHKGYCLQCLNNHNEAIQCFQMILQSEPNNKEAEENLKFSQQQLEN
eukprot:TRINITY_DN41789_c0_g1_i1.p1 TRINITY_DN41789_c0_g1~~TRINITY_DN41789_c0_g1_i1.p1  ORF type:complete len:245 (+),score=31.61 TRINITY_DN41789_c0_g1_i1:669-1403(+)